MPNKDAQERLSVEPIRVADVNFHVAKNIDQCPPGLQARELLMNGVEAELLPEENGTRRIRLYALEVEGAKKFAIRNTGHGMTGAELQVATDLASTIRKTAGLEAGQNRGEGAKVAALPWNKHGLRFRSCRTGSVTEAMLAKRDGVYVRLRETIEGEDGQPYYDPYWDVSEQATSEGYPVDADWTEVVCLGNAPDQDTTRWPYGPAIGQGTRREILTEIFDRFYALPDHVVLEADESLHGRKGSTAFRLMRGVIKKWGDDWTRLRAERVKLHDGIEIEFVHTPMLSGNNTVMGAHELTGQPARVAIVWRGEMYDAHIGAKWRHIAAGFGLPYIHSVVSVFIHLADDATVRDGPYRMDLRRKDTGEVVEVEHFQSDVRSVMPSWVKELVSESLKPRRVSDMSAVRAELERRLREARIRPVDLGRAGRERPELGVPGNGGNGWSQVPSAGAGNESVQERSKPQFGTIVDTEALAEAARNSPHNGARKPRRRAVQLITTAPEIVWLDETDKIEAEELADRAGRYVRTTNTLYLNALYPAVRGKVETLEKHYQQQVDLEQVRGLLTDKVRAAMALHIGSVVVFALAKQGLQSWTDDECVRALSSEALTVSADQSDYVMGDIRTGLSRTSEFQAAKAV